MKKTVAQMGMWVCASLLFTGADALAFGRPAHHWWDGYEAGYNAGLGQQVTPVVPTEDLAYFLREDNPYWAWLLQERELNQNPPAIDDPIAEAPVIDEPVVEAPVVEPPSTDDPSTIVEGPGVDDPVAIVEPPVELPPGAEIENPPEPYNPEPIAVVCPAEPPVVPWVVIDDPAPVDPIVEPIPAVEEPTPIDDDGGPLVDGGDTMVDDGGTLIDNGGIVLEIPPLEPSSEDPSLGTISYVDDGDQFEIPEPVFPVCGGHGGPDLWAGGWGWGWGWGWVQGGNPNWDVASAAIEFPLDAHVGHLIQVDPVDDVQIIAPMENFDSSQIFDAS